MQTPSSEQLRLFIAIQLPDAVKDRLQKAQSELKKAVPDAQIRWTTPDQFHLTLRFLGDVDAPRVEPLTEAIKGACHGFPVLHLQAEQVGFFPDAHYPKVVWAGVNDALKRLPDLQKAIQDATHAFTTQKPEGKFNGHVTLGRIKGISRSDADSLAKAASSFSTKRFGEWTANEVELIRSVLAHSGAQYETLAEVPLTPA